MSSSNEITWLEKSLAFYGAYHYNFMNKVVHVFCVWPIFFTAQIFLFNAAVPNALANIYPGMNWTLLVSLAYALYYFFIEQPGIAGPIASGLVMGGYFVTKELHEQNSEVWKVALGIHIFCWVAQIAAHKVFEKRSPALLDNIVQALVMAPLFVLLEVMFPLGYKPALHRKCESIAVKNIAEFRKSQKKN